MEVKKIKGKKLNKRIVEQSNETTQIAIGSILLLVGIIIGITISLNGTFALETATTSNATDSNATDSNATSSNATSSNAASNSANGVNATSGNVYLDNTKIYLEGIDIGKKEAKLGERINITLCTNKTLTNVILLFKSDKGNQFTVYLSNLNREEYFEIPSNIKIDTYYLSQLILESNDLQTTYVNGNNYNFDIKLTITNSTNKTYIFNNENITEDSIKEIAKSDEKSEITINATGNAIISKEIFNSIKGTNKKLIIKYNDNEIIFNGKDITEIKDIDVSITTSCISDDETFKMINNNGYIINFANNGTLPGKAIVKLKATDEMKNFFGKRKIYLYYYDETNNKFTLISKNITMNNDYYEFTINHNSKYILTDTKIDNTTVEVDNNVVDFQASNTHYLLWIGISIILIAVVIGIIIYLKKKETVSKKTNKLTNKKERD